MPLLPKWLVMINICFLITVNTILDIQSLLNTISTNAYDILKLKYSSQLTRVLWHQRVSQKCVIFGSSIGLPFVFARSHCLNQSGFTTNRAISIVAYKKREHLSPGKLFSNLTSAKFINFYTGTNELNHKQITDHSSTSSDTCKYASQN